MKLEEKTIPLQVLQSKVVDGGYCIGCGACAAAAPGAVRMELDQDGQYVARFDLKSGHADGADVLSVCPFYPEGPNENEIARDRFGNSCQWHDEIGYYRDVYAARVADDKVYQQSSSGGLARWMLREMLRRGLVDKVLHVEVNDDAAGAHELFRFAVTADPDDVLRSARSAYYPVEMSGVLEYVRDNPGRYALTGVPCFVKAVRRLGRHDPIYRERIVYCIGVICGHLKSTAYAEMLGWQLGVPPEDLVGIDFRVKIPGRNAKEKGVLARSRRDGDKAHGPRTVQGMFGTNYGEGYFKYNACDYCDDVVAETSDISIGDAWLPRFLDRGTSLVIARDADLAAIVREGIAEGAVVAEELSADEAADSQRGGFRHRRQDLRYRLWLADRAGKWRPEKRVGPSRGHIDMRRRAIARARMLVAAKSHQAFRAAKQRGDWNAFVRVMRPLSDRYRNCYRPPLRAAAYRGLSIVGVVPLLKMWRRRARRRKAA